MNKNKIISMYFIVFFWHALASLLFVTLKLVLYIEKASIAGSHTRNSAFSNEHLILEVISKMLSFPISFLFERPDLWNIYVYVSVNSAMFSLLIIVFLVFKRRKN